MSKFCTGYVNFSASLASGNPYWSSEMHLQLCHNTETRSIQLDLLDIQTGDGEPIAFDTFKPILYESLFQVLAPFSCTRNGRNFTVLIPESQNTSDFLNQVRSAFINSLDTLFFAVKMETFKEAERII